MTRPFLVTTYRDFDLMKPVATFFTWNDAETFALREGLFVGAGRYDRRAQGYRPVEKDWRAEYHAWLAEVDAQLTETRGDPMRRVA